ncbi:MAG: patatin-like phospholipase family protein, partial [Kordiimonas sp.]
MVTGWQKSLLFLCAILTPAMSAVSPTLAAEDDRLKIGLVLAGGGARGGAHIGVLKTLEENRIPVDYIAGTSFGAIVGALYASGYSAEELDRTLHELDWAKLLSDSAPRTHRSMQRKRDDQDASIEMEIGYKNGEFLLPTGLVRGNQLRLTLSQLMGRANRVTHFDQLPIPFRAVAADLLTGDEVILEDGNLASAVLASMSVPGLFPPFERGDQLLVDGGIVNNLPINVARSMGADIVIVVDIGAPPATREELTSFTKVLRQMIALLTRKSRQAQLETLKDTDILIKPDTLGISLTDFTKTSDTVPQGKAAAKAKLKSLLPYQLDETSWQHHLLSRKVEAHTETVEFIRINNTSRIADTFIEKNVRLNVGDKIDQKALAEDLTKIYGTGDFESIDYQVITENDQTGIEITAQNRRIGNDYLRFGVSLEDDFSGTSKYSLNAIYTKRGINDLGAEWRNKFVLGNNLRVETEFYQPLDDRQKFFSFAGGTLLRTTRGLVDD